MSRRVVITGMGAITPIGNTVYEFWSNIKKGVGDQHRNHQRRYTIWISLYHNFPIS